MQSNPFPSQSTWTAPRFYGSCSEQTALDVFSGNLRERYTVVDVPTIGLPLRFFLYYNSQETVSGPVGNKWRHNLMMKLSFTTGAYPLYCTYTAEAGAQYIFNPASSGAPWQLDQGTNAVNFLILSSCFPDRLRNQLAAHFLSRWRNLSLRQHRPL